MKYLAFLLTIGFATFAATSADAQVLKGGGFSGTLITQTAVAPNNSRVDIYTTPVGLKALKYILTQVRVENRKDVVFTGSTMGTMPLMDDCTTFNPGLAIPKGETLTFTEDRGNGDMAVLITGILSKK